MTDNYFQNEEGLGLDLNFWLNSSITKSFINSSNLGRTSKSTKAEVSTIPTVKSINYCDKPGNEKVIVIFSDNTKVIKNMCAGDTFDLNIGVALCIAERLYGTKSKFHKMIKNKLSKNCIKNKDKE